MLRKTMARGENSNTARDELKEIKQYYCRKQTILNFLDYKQK